MLNIIAVSSCLLINNITLTDNSVIVTYEIIQGHPDTVSLDHSNDNVTFINLATNISSTQLQFTMYGTFNTSQSQYFRMRAYEKGFSHSLHCSPVYEWSLYSVKITDGKYYYIQL